MELEFVAHNIFESNESGDSIVRLVEHKTGDEVHQPTNLVLDEIKEKWKRKAVTLTKGSAYSHFDSKAINLQTIRDKVEIFNWVTEPEHVVNHSFLPMIKFDITFKRVKKAKDDCVDMSGYKKLATSGDVTLWYKDKTRKICISSHLDKCIYQYYSFMLNEYYNSWMDQHNIGDVAIAYRTNLHKASYILAKEVWDSIQGYEKCLVIVSDFESFFDNIDPGYLKQNLCEVLGESELTPDWYAVYKSLVKYAYVNMNDIAKLLSHIMEPQGDKDGKTTLLSQKQINSQDLVPNIQCLKKWMKDYNSHKPDGEDNICVHHNGENQVKALGIPQGSSVSAVMANVYMIHFDEKINSLVKELGGSYRRYSDDVIIALPIQTESQCSDLYNQIKESFGYFKQNHIVEISKDKTKSMAFVDGAFYELTDAKDAINYSKPVKLTYLGLVFDGSKVGIRQSGITKYYYRMHKKASNYVSQNMQAMTDPESVTAVCPKLPNCDFSRITEHACFNKKRYPLSRKTVQRKLPIRCPRNLYRQYGPGVYKKGNGTYISYLRRVNAAVHLDDPHVKPLIKYPKYVIRKFIKKCFIGKVKSCRKL